MEVPLEAFVMCVFQIDKEYLAQPASFCLNH
ncbi:DUF1196 domain-containing protein [Vibrio cincinnatiensis]|nr:DUF1196 domain-containing protein [Vibrio cincinnatiensis]